MNPLECEMLLAQTIWDRGTATDDRWKIGIVDKALVCIPHTDTRKMDPIFAIATTRTLNEGFTPPKWKHIVNKLYLYSIQELSCQTSQKP